MATTAPISTELESSEERLEPQTGTESPAAAQESDLDAIARLAYGFWLERQGLNEGSAEEDWLRAEEEFRNRRSAAREDNNSPAVKIKRGQRAGRRSS